MLNASIMMCLLLTSATAEIAGRVVDDAGKPIENAIVVISTCKPRIGPSTTCPSCYLDCKKRTLTDRDGRFTIKELSPTLLFSLAAGAPQHQGFVSKYFDPALDPQIELELPKLSQQSLASSVSGQVVDAEGAPIVGAEVHSKLIQYGNIFTSGGEKSVTPLTLTDTNGNFQLTAGDHIVSIELRVNAAGYAPTEIKWERGNDKAIRVQLGYGAVIRGRLLLGDQPLGGVEVGLVQRNRMMGNINTPAEVSTDEEGVFQFEQLPPSMDYALYTHTGQGAKGVLPVSLIEAPGHGQLADLGDIPTQTPRRLTIIVRTEDGGPLPAKATLYVGRGNAWRGTLRDLTQQPSTRLILDDISDEEFEISLRVPGYDVVRTTPVMNLDLNRRYLIRVDKDMEIIFVVRQPGAAAPPEDRT